MLTFSIAVPGGSERSPKHVEQLLIACGPMLKYSSLTLGYRRSGSQIVQTLSVVGKHADAVRSQLADAFPDATIEKLSDVSNSARTQGRVYGANIRLRPDVFALKCSDEFEDRLLRTLTDPVTQILAAMQSGRSRNDGIEITLCRAKGIRCRQAERIVESLGLPVLASGRSLSRWYLKLRTDHRSSVRLFGRMIALLLGAIRRPNGASKRDAPDPAKVRSPFLLETTITVTTSATSRTEAKQQIQRIAGSFSVFDTDMCRLEVGRTNRSRNTGRKRKRRGFLLTPQEVASLWHPPTAEVRVAGTYTSPFRQREPPVHLPTPREEEGVATLGRIVFRHRRDIFGIRRDDRFRHLAVLGKTGMGKSTLLKALVAADINAGRGVMLLDPHGDLAEDLLACVPRHRTNDVCYFDAGNRQSPIAFNPLACKDPSQRPLVASGIVASFKKIYGDSWGPRLEYILRHALLALVERPDSTLASVLRLLSDAKFREQTITQVADPVVRTFWEHEFSRWKPQLQIEAVAPIQNKIGQFISNPILRNVLESPQNRIDLRDMMDRSKILIVNLSKGRIGEDASGLLGSLLVSQLQLAAMSRADTPMRERADFFAYVDEFQNFATESFAAILSEARKYRLSLTVANQYLAQLDDATLHALFGNVGTILSFQVGAKDAELIAEQFGEAIEPADLMALPKFTAYARLLIDGLPSRPFSMQTIALVDLKSDSRIDIIRKTSQHRYGTKHA